MVMPESLALFISMLRIRTFEERVAELLRVKEITGPVHLCTGQEAIPVGVCAALEPQDYVFGTHRSHGHYLARGGDMKALMAELFGKTTGCCKGRGGSMHLSAPEVGFLGSVPIVSGSIPMAVGAALAAKMLGENRVSVAFFGDGATDEGVFYESLNFAALRKLPVVFVCENNEFASHLHVSERCVDRGISDIAPILGVKTFFADGNRVTEVGNVAAAAVKAVRAGKGPALLECFTYRLLGHVGPNLDVDVGLNRVDDLLRWRKRDPIYHVASQLQLPSLCWEKLADVRREVEDAVTYARESPYPLPETLTDYVFKQGDNAND